jgi:transcriptional regulator with XRE-family HTH domain
MSGDGCIPDMRDHVSMAEDTVSDMAAALRWLRERIGISRDQLATASGVSAVHIKFIERGKRNPSEAVVQRLLPALRVTRADLDGLLSLRPWASSTASGAPATLTSYAAGVPLAVDEGAEFEAAIEITPATPAAMQASPASAPPPPSPVPPPLAAAMPRTMRASSGEARPQGATVHPPAPRAAPKPAPTPARAGSSLPPPRPQPPTLDAELIELRERYVHLPRSKQQMVLGWLRTLDDR